MIGVKDCSIIRINSRLPCEGVHVAALLEVLVLIVGENWNATCCLRCCSVFGLLHKKLRLFEFLSFGIENKYNKISVRQQSESISECRGWRHQLGKRARLVFTHFLWSCSLTMKYNNVYRRRHNSCAHDNNSSRPIINEYWRRVLHTAGDQILVITWESQKMHTLLMDTLKYHDVV